MCIFTVEAGESRPIHVAGTRIFARLDGADQLLAYQMSFAAARDVAMVLPVPVRPGLGEDALRFIDLSRFDELFDSLAALFPAEASAALRGFAGEAQDLEQSMLVVHRVGAFEASYVPTIADFGRLDRRFRLPAEVWDALPAYRDFGFAVFKLFQPRRGLLERWGLRRPEPDPSSRRAHPMAFAFPTRSPDRLYFPTVHVHDGEVHREASFDHELYCQLSTEPAPTHGRPWERAPMTPSRWDVERSKGLLVDGACFRLVLQGTLPNDDVHVAGPARG